MAERRMFTLKIVDSDAFLDMPLSTQALYFHLNMRADDDGFVNNPKKVARMIGASEDDIKLLIAKRFLLAFNNGLVVIKHWHMHNLVRKDRYNPTQYIEQKLQIELKKNGAYTEKDGLDLSECSSELPDNQMATTWQPNGNQMATQVRLGKCSIGKDKNICPKDQVQIGSKYTDDFERVWAVYPRHDDKAQAYVQYKARLNSGWSDEELFTASQAYANACLKNRTDKKYIKMGKTFFGANTPFMDYLPRKGEQSVDRYTEHFNAVTEGINEYVERPFA